MRHLLADLLTDHVKSLDWKLLKKDTNTGELTEINVASGGGYAYVGYYQLCTTEQHDLAAHAPGF